jgi:alginate O-acetyltransferase complex protein AlgI
VQVLASSAPSAPEDPREANAETSFARFAFIVLQLAVLLAVFWRFPIAVGPGAIFFPEEPGAAVAEGGPSTPVFFTMACLSFGGFAVHYWLPLRHKETFWVLLSLGGAAVLLSPMIAGLVLVAGLALYAIAASRAPYWVKAISILAGIVGVLISATTPLYGTFAPKDAWQIFGSIFMFRMIIYMYDIRRLDGRPALSHFLVYFYALPNWAFVNFPAVDYQTQRLSLLRRDIHVIAQEGIRRMARGAGELAIFQWVQQELERRPVEHVKSPSALLIHLVLFSLTYLWVAGTFHVIVGILHLFGYDLPETNRRYGLATSPLDFWRRINIYFKDFMVKVVYFPVYFRLRGWSKVGAQVVGTAAVFLASWAMHIWMTMWLGWEGQAFYLTEALFWGIFGLACVIELLFESRRPPRRDPAGGRGWPGILRRGLSILGMNVFFMVLSRMYGALGGHSESRSLDVFIDLVRHGLR